MNTLIDSMNTEVQEFLYKPRVELGKPDGVFFLGPFRAAVWFSNMRSLGLIQYHAILLVCEGERELFYAACETNPSEAEKFYLGSFLPKGHSTVFNSPLLQYFGICCGCLSARTIEA